MSAVQREGLIENETELWDINTYNCERLEFIVCEVSSRLQHGAVGFQSNTFHGIRQLNENVCAILFDFFFNLSVADPGKLKQWSNNGSQQLYWWLKLQLPSLGNGFCEPDSIETVTGSQYMQNYNNCLHLFSLSESFIDFPFCTQITEYIFKCFINC